jgi:hypothetical protein
LLAQLFQRGELLLKAALSGHDWKFNA